MAMPTDVKERREKSNKGKPKSKTSFKNVRFSTEKSIASTKFNKEKGIHDRWKARKPFQKTHVKRNFRDKKLKVPEMYKQAARILQDVDEKKASVKNLVFNARRDVRKIYAIVLQSLKYKNIILRLTNKSRLFQKEKHLNPYLARVLIYDMMFGRKSLTGDSRPIQTVLKHRGDISRALRRIMIQASVKTAEELLDKESILVQTVPRYARVNTLLTTTENVIREFEKASYKQLKYEEGITQDEFYDLIKKLEKGQFIQDINFSDLFVFSQKENLSQSKLYQNGQIILEDKTSYLAAKVLAPPEGSIVIDGCAAPGIKTAHLAALMNNKGKIFACDINEERMELLKNVIGYTGVKCSSTILTDFTSIKPNNEEYASVEYILLDPSCSGTGMVSRLDALTDDKNSKSYERIKKLSAFQTVLLKHALSFKNLKRLVYSTCSINVEENEEVVKEALSGWEETYRVVSAFPDWPTRGKEEYEFGPLCLRAYPNVNLTNGFFIAVIERIEGSKKSKKKKKAKSGISVNNEKILQDGGSSNSQEINKEECKAHEERTVDNSVKKSKKRLKSKDSTALSATTDSKQCKDVESKKKRKKSKNNALVDNEKFATSQHSVSQKTDTLQSDAKHSSKKRKVSETEPDAYCEHSTEGIVVKKHKKKKKKIEI